MTTYRSKLPCWPCVVDDIFADMYFVAAMCYSSWQGKGRQVVFDNSVGGGVGSKRRRGGGEGEGVNDG